MFKILVTILFLSISSSVWAYTETFYLKKNGDASAPETIAGAFDASDFNTAGNWDTDDQDDGKIGHNDRVIVLDDDGTIVTTLTIQQSGASGKPITIEGETDVMPTITNSTASVDFDEKDYIEVIDLTLDGPCVDIGNNCKVKRCVITP